MSSGTQAGGIPAAMYNILQFSLPLKYLGISLYLFLYIFYAVTVICFLPDPPVQFYHAPRRKQMQEFSTALVENTDA